MASDVIRREGFLLVQSSSGLDGWSRFYESRKEAEAEAISMLPRGHRMRIVPITEFSTKSMEDREDMRRPSIRV
jgi:hypothetical protein